MASSLIGVNDPNDLLPIFSSSQSSNDETIAAAVIMPHKLNFMCLVDNIMPEAREVGAINTVINRVDRQMGKNRLLGTNTDYIGIRQSFLTLPSFIEQHTAGKRRPAIVIGGGRAARGAMICQGIAQHILWIENKFPDLRAIAQQLGEIVDEIVKRNSK